MARISSDFKMDLISHGNRTEWSPIQSVIIRVITEQSRTTAKRESDLLITSMITDFIKSILKSLVVPVI